MVDNRFHYDEELLEECTRSALAGFVSENTTTSSRAVELDQSCLHLFLQHTDHYRRHQEAKEGYRYRLYDEGNGYDISDSLRNFVRNAVFVHEHNRQAGNGFKVALNRFAHMDLNTILESGEDVEPFHRQLRSRSYGYGYHPIRPFGQSHTDVSESNTFETTHDEDTMFEELTEEKIHKISADLAIGKGSYNKMTPKHHKKKYYEDAADMVVEMPMDNQERFEASYVKDTSGDGTLFSIHRNSNKKTRKHHKSHAAIDANSEESFSTYLNWATEDNPGTSFDPFDMFEKDIFCLTKTSCNRSVNLCCLLSVDGVPIVHDAFDQVSAVSIILTFVSRNMDYSYHFHVMV